MGADLCSTLGDTERGRLRGSVVLPTENLVNFVCQTVLLGEYLCDNWSTEWVHFAVLNTDVEVFFSFESTFLL